MYDFKNNVGYPTKKHLDAIKKYGLIDGYRMSYGPIKEVINEYIFIFDVSYVYNHPERLNL